MAFQTNNVTASLLISILGYVRGAHYIIHHDQKTFCYEQVLMKNLTKYVFVSLILFNFWKVGTPNDTLFKNISDI